MPFKNLFNEWFAKDTSRKVKASLKAKFHNGERISAYAPIGYLKDPEVKNHLVVDPETRWIVEKSSTTPFTEQVRADHENLDSGKSPHTRLAELYPLWDLCEHL